jgi:hypothetical protein
LDGRNLGFALRGHGHLPVSGNRSQRYQHRVTDALTRGGGVGVQRGDAGEFQLRDPATLQHVASPPPAPGPRVARAFGGSSARMCASASSPPQPAALVCRPWHLCPGVRCMQLTPVPAFVAVRLTLRRFSQRSRIVLLESAVAVALGPLRLFSNLSRDCCGRGGRQRAGVGRTAVLRVTRAVNGPRPSEAIETVGCETSGWLRTENWSRRPIAPVRGCTCSTAESLPLAVQNRSGLERSDFAVAVTSGVSRLTSNSFPRVLSHDR